MRSVFISYSSGDAEHVRTLAADVESLGHRVWFDQALAGGQRWWDQILQEIRETDVFVFAVSAGSADSRACLSELRYAEALGKPVVPVTVERNFTESLLPPSLAQIQRVDYTSQDKQAFATLLRAFSTLPAAPPLPEELPEAPPVPASYLFDLKTAIGEPGHMEASRQEELLAELRGRLNSGHSHDDVLALTQRFRQRDDLLLRVDRQLTEFEAELRASGQPSGAAPAAPTSPIAGVEVPPRVEPPPAPVWGAVPTPQTSAPLAGAADTPPAEEPVPWWWWAVVIFFGLIGGAVAFLVHREKSPAAAKNLLIGGIVASVAWVLISLW
jgi:hypothetical protein